MNDCTNEKETSGLDSDADKTDNNKPHIQIPDQYFNKISTAIEDPSQISVIYENHFDEKAKKINEELSKNEDQKRNFREKLLKLVSILINIQLVFFNIIILLIVGALIFDFSFFRQMSDMSINLLSFLKYYITATIVELLSMLFFILRYVFIDRSELKKEKNQE